MSLVLVDSSVWIDYFKGSGSNELNDLIDKNQICTNEIILAELLPILIHKKQTELVSLLKHISIIDLKINWEEIMNYQTTNLKKGINQVGIPDLIIVQNLLQNSLVLFTKDKHFKLMSKEFKFKMF